MKTFWSRVMTLFTRKAQAVGREVYERYDVEEWPELERECYIFRFEYELRQIDAWQEEEGCWIWNASYHIATVSIPANVKDLESALLYRMRKAGIVSRLGRTKLANIDGSLYELQDRKTGEPLIAFIPVNH